MSILLYIAISEKKRRKSEQVGAHTIAASATVQTNHLHCNNTSASLPIRSVNCPASSTLPGPIPPIRTRCGLPQHRPIFPVENEVS